MAQLPGGTILAPAPGDTVMTPRGPIPRKRRDEIDAAAEPIIRMTPLVGTAYAADKAVRGEGSWADAAESAAWDVGGAALGPVAGLVSKSVKSLRAARSVKLAKLLDDGRPTTHLVHKTGMDIQYTGPGRWAAQDANSAYRITGQQQIDDMIESGLVRSKPPGAKAKGGRTGVTHWSQGRESLVYDFEGLPNGYILKTKSGGLEGKTGGIALKDLEGVYTWRDGKIVNVLDEIKQKSAAAQKAKRAVPLKDLK